MGYIGASKLNPRKAEIIKDLLQLKEFSHQQIADLFGVSRVLITAINNGRRWNIPEHSFEMKEETPKSNDFREFSNPYKPQGRNMTEFEIEYLTEKISKMIEDNEKELSNVKSITINFE